MVTLNATTNAVKTILAESKEAFDELVSTWGNSPFLYLVLLPSSSKGAKMAKMAANVCKEEYNISVGKKEKGARGKDYDKMLGGYRTEIKSSTAWGGNPNHFRFQQVRRTQHPERYVFIGLNVDGNVKMWWCSRQDLDQHLFPLDVNIQHGGSKGHEQEYWFSTENGVPSYLKSMDTF